MAEDLNVDPAELRRLGDANHGLAAYHREVHKPDMGVVDSWQSFGPGAQVAIDRAVQWAVQFLPTGWNHVADHYQNIGDVHHMNANTFESHEAAAGTHVRQKGEEI